MADPHDSLQPPSYLDDLYPRREELDGIVGGDPTQEIADALAAHVQAAHGDLVVVSTMTQALAAKADANHSHAELPTPGQKNALDGTQGTPGTNNRYVTGSDSRLSDARTPIPHGHTAQEISGLSSGDTTAKLSADAASNAVALADTGLSFPVVSGTVYRFEAYLAYRTAALTTGIRIGAAFPGVTAFAASVRIAGFAADGVDSEFVGALSASGDSVVSTAVVAANTDHLAVVEGLILPSADGTFKLQHATEIANSAATVRRGSHLAHRAV